MWRFDKSLFMTQKQKALCILGSDTFELSQIEENNLLGQIKVISKSAHNGQINEKA